MTRIQERATEEQVRESPPAAQEAAGGPTPAPAGATHAIRVCFGRRWVVPELVAQLQAGSILELECEASAPAEVFADGRLAGLGAPVLVEGRLGIRMQRKT